MENIVVVNQSRVELVDHMGSDLTTVNAARQSFNTESQVLNGRDIGLINFLGTGLRTSEWHNLLAQLREVVTSSDKSLLDFQNVMMEFKRDPQHWLPFAHNQVTLKVAMPLFLARQFSKSQVGGVWSEESRRYIDFIPEIYLPAQIHLRPEDDIKQGSGLPHPNSEQMLNAMYQCAEHALVTYQALIDAKVAPEEARMILPQNIMINLTWTGSLLFFARVVNQRVSPNAQRAASDLGTQISEVIRPLFPHCWQVLVGDR